METTISCIRGHFGRDTFQSEGWESTPEEEAFRAEVRDWLASVIDVGREGLGQAKRQGLLRDYRVDFFGQDLVVLSTRDRDGIDREARQFLRDTYDKCSQVARAVPPSVDEDPLTDPGPGDPHKVFSSVVEMEINERPQEPIMVFMGDEVSPGTFNLPLYEIFAEPFRDLASSGEPRESAAEFQIRDASNQENITLHAPNQMSDILTLVEEKDRYLVVGVRNDLRGEMAAVSTATSISPIVGRRADWADPTMIVRCEGSFPSHHDVLRPFLQRSRSNPRGPVSDRDYGLFTPVGLDYSRHVLSGSPRLVIQGFRLSGGVLTAQIDPFADAPSGVDEERLESIWRRAAKDWTDEEVAAVWTWVHSQFCSDDAWLMEYAYKTAASMVNTYGLYVADVYEEARDRAISKINDLAAKRFRTYDPRKSKSKRPFINWLCTCIRHDISKWCEEVQRRRETDVRTVDEVRSAPSSDRSLIDPIDQYWSDVEPLLGKLRSESSLLAEAITLKYGPRRLTLAEAAEAGKCSIGAMKVRLHRGRQKLGPWIALRRTIIAHLTDPFVEPPLGQLFYDCLQGLSLDSAAAAVIDSRHPWSTVWFDAISRWLRGRGASQE